MDRRQRGAELRTMLASPQGLEQLLAIYRRHAGEGDESPPPEESLLVETVLNFEYQTEGLPQQGRDEGDGTEPAPPVLEARESGDVKFSEPPAAEGPGG